LSAAAAAASRSEAEGVCSTPAGLVEAFLGVYPDLCAQAPERHRALHDPRDFPSVAEVRQAFSFSWRYVSFGVPGKLRDIAPELWDEERSKAAQLLTSAAQEAQQVMRTALAELVQHLAERLQTTDEGKPVLLHKSAVSNLLDFLDTLDFRNVTNDADLKRLADEARALSNSLRRAQAPRRFPRAFGFWLRLFCMP
jgi:hypothetical protein